MTKSANLGNDKLNIIIDARLPHCVYNNNNITKHLGQTYAYIYVHALSVINFRIVDVTSIVLFVVCLIHNKFRFFITFISIKISFDCLSSTYSIVCDWICLSHIERRFFFIFYPDVYNHVIERDWKTLTHRNATLCMCYFFSLLMIKQLIDVEICLYEIWFDVAFCHMSTIEEKEQLFSLSHFHIDSMASADNRKNKDEKGES